jgi:hypothetical protein
MDEIRENLPLTRQSEPWYMTLFVWLNWAVMVVVAAYGPPDFRPWACGAAVLMMALLIVQRVVVQRLADNLIDLVEAYKEGARLDAKLIEAHAAEVSHYRRAFVYAAGIRRGKAPMQAGLIAARDVQMPPTEDIS